MHCSPSRHKHSVKNQTCLKRDEILAIAAEVNSTVQRPIIPLSTSKKVHAKLAEHFIGVCKDKREYCWLKHISWETRKRLEDAFRPRKPASWAANNRTWLNTNDINAVMMQYEKLYKDFKFYGVFPIDFNQYVNGVCISSLMCDFDIARLRAEKKKRFAFVLNLDDHTGPGSHWVAVYCNIDSRKPNFGIYYYDSVADKRDQTVIDFMSRVQSQVMRDHPKTGKRFENRANSIKKQFKNSECGMFCIVFLTQCAKNIPFDVICKRMKTDDEINKIRDIIYRSE
jgi:hypothetical protein